MFRKIFAAALLMTSFVMQVSANLEGVYSVFGFDPVTGPYAGTAVITKDGQAYQGTWTFPDPSGPIIEPNTGILKDGVLSFVFLFVDTYGVSSYDIHQHGKVLEGKWVYLDSNLVGYERLDKISELVE